MRMRGGPASVNIKIILLFTALMIGGGTLYYTHALVKKLQVKEKQVVQLYAKGLEYIANSSTDESDITFLFENIIRPIDFPLILTDADNNINMLSSTEIRNIKYDTTLSEQELKAFFAQKIKEMDEVNEPIYVKYVAGTDTIILTKIHFGDSELIDQMKYYPYIQLLVASIFIIIGYISFSQIKRSEQSNIWVGMAKETAHQFGTPISSLMGWVELLKISYKDPDKVEDIAEEIENDIEKLNKITARFSKIGSKPELKKLNVIEEVNKVADYFKRRLPQTGKAVEINVTGDETAMAYINPELFDWVAENLIKNALDAIDHPGGKIDISVKGYSSHVDIEFADNGKGIEMKRRKDIFRPGYSTKRRGWGLGLSLSKRIVEEYHQGKIYVKASSPGAGTVFKVVLKS